MDPVLSWFTADSSIVTGVYGPPQWSSIAAIRAACAKLPTATQKPAQFVAGLCYPCCAGCAADWDDFRALLNRRRARPGGIRTSMSELPCSVMPSYNQANTKRPSTMASCEQNSAGWLCLCMSCKLCAPPGVRVPTPTMSRIPGAWIFRLRRKFPRLFFNLLTPSVTMLKSCGNSWTSRARATHCLQDPARGVSRHTHTHTGRLRYAGKIL